MRTLTKILTVAALAMFVSSVANANVVITLSQVGGTYNAGAGAVASDTLILDVGYTITGSDAITIIDPAIAFDTAAATFVTGSETALALWSAGSVAMNPLGAAGFTVQPNGPGVDYVDGLEKSAPLGQAANAPCFYGACTSLGTLTFHLTGAAGVIDSGSVLPPLPFGTTIQTVGAVSVTGLASLGTFTIVGIPEPTTASLLGLGLLGLTVAGRRRN